MPDTLPLDAQIAVWGAAWWWSGLDIDEAKNPAPLCEHRPGQWLPDDLWDRTLAYLDRVERWHGSVRMPVPWWWALAVSSDLVMAGLTTESAARLEPIRA